MGKNKLKHLEEMKDFPNVFQLDKRYKGKWKTEVFKNTNPITLELACGKGEYSVQLAEKNRDRNFIGIDIKGPRIYTGAKQAIDRKLDNVVFLRMLIDHLPDYFEAEEVDEIWITFPDPHSRKGKAKQRLTSSKFNAIYSKVLKPGGTIHLKTDDTGLYDFTLETVKESGHHLLYNDDDIYSGQLFDPVLSIKTYYEKMHLAEGKQIKYVKYRL